MSLFVVEDYDDAISDRVFEDIREFEKFMLEHPSSTGYEYILKDNIWTPVKQYAVIENEVLYRTNLLKIPHIYTYYIDPKIECEECGHANHRKGYECLWCQLCTECTELKNDCYCKVHDDY